MSLKKINLKVIIVQRVDAFIFMQKTYPWELYSRAFMRIHMMIFDEVRNVKIFANLKI